MPKNPELELALNFIEKTDRNLFITGKAGTGKTTFLHQIKKESLKRLVIVAPTGVAAINAKGVTIPSQMRYVHYYGKILSVSYLFLFLYYQLIQQYSHTHISPLFCRKKKKDRRSC